MVIKNLQGIAAAYQEAYEQPPYNEGPEQVATFKANLSKEISYEGFGMLSAISNTKIVGFSYGWTMAAGKWWSRANEEPPEHIAAAQKFAVIEWVVIPERQAEGIGSKLLHGILQGRPEELATLASDPRSKAREMYTKSGWEKVGNSELPWGPVMDILIRRLTSHDSH